MGHIQMSACKHWWKLNKACILTIAGQRQCPGFESVLFKGSMYYSVFATPCESTILSNLKVQTKTSSKMIGNSPVSIYRGLMKKL